MNPDVSYENTFKRDALSRSGVVNKNVTYFGDEQEMILSFVQLVKVSKMSTDFVFQVSTLFCNIFSVGQRKTSFSGNFAFPATLNLLCFIRTKILI